MASRPELKGAFVDAHGNTWKIYHADRKEHPRIFTHEGKLAYGRTFFGGRRKHKIYIDNSGTADEIFETTHHELGHVALRDLGIDDMIEEAFVQGFSLHVADYLNQLKV